MSAPNNSYDIIVIGAGVAGICQLKHLVDRGFNTLVLESNHGLGGTWYSNRYPGCRFDSESYTYGYAFSRELLEEWHWKEMFSPQPENLKYLNYVADKFDLRRHIRFDARVSSMAWSEDQREWTVKLTSGDTIRSRFVVTCVGALSVPTLPHIEGMEDFKGQSFHTYHWPHDPVDLAGKRVGIIGTGATAIQIIPEIAGEVGSLHVFQRSANWSVPLNNSEISEADMARIRARYDEIFDICAQSNGGFDHLPDRRGYHNVTPGERIALWDALYDAPGFALLIANFPEIFLDEEANHALSQYVAGRIRQRVLDPAVANKLIPKDHGFGMRRLPLETNYFEAYNRNNVHLVDLMENPIERVTPSGIRTANGDIELDLIIYATGFDALIGALRKMDIQGSNGLRLQDKWRDETSTYLGLLSHGFPNLLMVAGPQSVSGSTNYPRAIETGVEWVTDLLCHARETGVLRIEAKPEAEKTWVQEVEHLQNRMPFSKVRSWFTGYSPNAEAGAPDRVRYNAYWGGAPRYRAALEEEVKNNYGNIELTSAF